MRSTATRLIVFRHLALALVMMIGIVCAAHAAPVNYAVTLDGPSEAPPNASLGLGTASVVVDVVAHTLKVDVTFAGLTGNTTACHIHAPTAVALTGTAGVATTTPTFLGFPLGVTAGAYLNTLDETLASSWNAPFVTANGGTPGSAEVALATYIAAGKAYLNIHSSIFGGGEIRGFLIPGQPTPNAPSSWGRIKSLYR